MSRRRPHPETIKAFFKGKVGIHHRKQQAFVLSEPLIRPCFRCGSRESCEHDQEREGTKNR